MARRKDEITRQREELERVRAEAWKELWKQARYVKLDVEHQKALKLWNHLDSEKNTAFGKMPANVKMLEDVDRLCKAYAKKRQKFEDDFLLEYVRSHGFPSARSQY